MGFVVAVVELNAGVSAMFWIDLVGTIGYHSLVAVVVVVLLLLVVDMAFVDWMWRQRDGSKTRY